ncbi:hypothetical protein D3C79_523690 [compost metagenome]
MAGLDGEVGHGTRLGIILERQVQQETHHLLGIVEVHGHDQFDRNAARTVHGLQVQVHFEADAVLVQAVQRVARRQGDAADVGQVVDHHLQDLAFDRLRWRGDEVVEGGHR